MRPKIYMEHPVMSADQIRSHTQAVWDRFYSFRSIWKRSRGSVSSIKARLAFVLISKIYRQMYANTGIATDSARVNRSAQWARWMAIPCRRLFAGRPMPDLEIPIPAPPVPADGYTGRLSSRVCVELECGIVSAGCDWFSGS